MVGFGLVRVDLFLISISCFASSFTEVATSGAIVFFLSCTEVTLVGWITFEI